MAKAKKPTKYELATIEFNNFLASNMIARIDDDSFSLPNGINLNYGLPVSTYAQLNRMSQIVKDINRFAIDRKVGKNGKSVEVNVGKYDAIEVNPSSVFVPKAWVDDKDYNKNVATMFNALQQYELIGANLTPLELAYKGYSAERDYLSKVMPSKSVDKRLSSLDSQIQRYTQTQNDPSSWTSDYKDDYWYKNWKQNFGK